ncbi:MAG: hypothetical protein ACLSCQ_04545 [Evtepia gabavorous]
MAMTVIWTGMTALSLLCALAMGNQGELASAALDGAASAIELGISMAGVLCLWMGVMEVMQRAGLAESWPACCGPSSGGCFRILPGIGGPWTPSPPMSRPTCWDWATPPPPWGWRLPGG